MLRKATIKKPQKKKISKKLNTKQLALKKQPSIQKIFDEVLPIIQPSETEMQNEIQFANSLKDHIAENVSKDKTVVLSGSIAKKTFLKDKKDIDVFVLFDSTTPKETLENELKKIMENAFPSLKYQLSYAEHPYARFIFEGRRIDLVPAYRISDTAMRISAVDRSIFHTKYVNDTLNSTQIKDVLMLKAFLKSNGLYGAEIKIQGFSGYLCELLIIKFGSFSKLLTAASKWSDNVLIDLMKFYSKKEFAQLHQKYGFFVCIDPVDKNRNVSAAVSFENFAKFVKISKEFLKSPHSDFFLKPPESFEQKISKKAKKGTVYFVKIPRPNIVEDVLWGQIYKVSGQLLTYLKEFDPISIIPTDTEHLVIFGIILKKNKLSDKKLLIGPPLKMKKNVEEFMESHKEAIFSKKNGKLTATLIRKNTDPKNYIDQFFADLSKTKSFLAYSPEFIVIEKSKVI